MYLLRWIFRFLMVCGCWRPPSWTSPYKKFVYTIYAVFLFLLVYIVTFFQFMDIVVNVRTQDEFSDNFYLLLAMLVSCHKMFCMIISRRNIATLADILENEPFQPGNSEEMEIRRRFDRRAQSNAIFYMIIVEVTVMCTSLNGVLRVENGKLLYRMWLPYEHISPFTISFTCVQQILALCAGSLIHVACDSLIWGLLIHIYSQFEILGCRLRAIRQNANEFATMVNKQFQMIMCVQFAVSTLVVCFNLYQLTKMGSANTKLLEIILYTSCMLTQISLYCWYGNEVKLKSLEVPDMIFGIDWMVFDKDTNRMLLMIMRRATVSIEITSIHVISMNLESFMNLLKTSYSAYNVLQRGQG